MKTKRFTSVALVAGFLIFSVPLRAHHGYAAFYTTKQVTLKGTVTEWKWANPHCLVHIDVKDSKGEVKDWIIEFAAPTLMTRVGWTKESLKPGDTVIAETHPAKNGATTGLSGSASSLLKFVVNGHELPSH